MISHEYSAFHLRSIREGTGWQRCIGCLKLKISFRKRANNYRALLRKLTCKDKASCGPSPPCIHTCTMWQRVSFHDNFLPHCTITSCPFTCLSLSLFLSVFLVHRSFCNTKHERDRKQEREREKVREREKETKWERERKREGGGNKNGIPPSSSSSSSSSASASSARHLLSRQQSLLLAPIFHRKVSVVIDEKWTMYIHIHIYIFIYAYIHIYNVIDEKWTRAFTRNGRMIFATSTLTQLKEEERKREKENPKERKGGGGERQRASRWEWHGDTATKTERNCFYYIIVQPDDFGLKHRRETKKGKNLCVHTYICKTNICTYIYMYIYICIRTYVCPSARRCIHFVVYVISRHCLGSVWVLLHFMNTILAIVNRPRFPLRANQGVLNPTAALSLLKESGISASVAP